VQEKLIPLCRLYENTSNTTGRRYFVGNLSFTSKLLLFQNDEAKDGEPGWTLFLAEREQKPQQARPVGNEKPGTPIWHGVADDPGEPVRRRPYPQQREV
jgi:hypothetical protein